MSLRREIEDDFRRTLFETDAGVRGTLSATQRKLDETDARSSEQGAADWHVGPAARI